MSLTTHGDPSSDPTRAQRLNRFQQAMGLWERIHPYNAGHILRIRGEFDRARLQQCIETECRTCGIGALTLDSAKSSFTYQSIDSIKLDVRRQGSAGADDFDADLSRDLNNSFPDQPHHPLRWIVFIDDDNAEWKVAVVYHHLASDAHGILLLLARVLRAYFGDSVDDSRLRLVTCASPFRLKPSENGSRFGLVRSFLAMLRSYFAMRHAHRLHEHRDSGDTTSLVTRAAPAGFVAALAARCKQINAGVNDAFLAAMAQTIAERTPNRRKHARRHKIAIASAVNLRAWSRDDLSTCFGTYVGHSIILVDDPDATFDSLLAQVIRQTHLHKQQRRAAGPAWPLIFAKYLWPILRIPNNTASYRKLYPLCAGASSVRVDSTLFGRSAANIIDYTRICPPGPAMPMVLAPTTFGNAMQLSLVFRDGAMAINDAREMLNRVIDILMNFAGFTPATTPVSSAAATVLLKPARRNEPVPAQG